MNPDWIIRINGKRYKPLPVKQIEELFRQGKIPATAETSQDGQNWTAVQSLIAELSKPKVDRDSSIVNRVKKQVTCQCGKKYSVDVRAIGRKLKCPACNATILVPVECKPTEDHTLKAPINSVHNNPVLRRCLEVKDPVDIDSDQLLSELLKKIPVKALEGAIVCPIVANLFYGGWNWKFVVFGAVCGAICGLIPKATGGLFIGALLVGVPTYLLGYSKSVYLAIGFWTGVVFAVPLMILDFLTWKEAFKGPYSPRAPLPGELEKLVERLQSDLAHDRSRAAITLCELGPASQAALIPLSQLLKDTESFVRESAVRAIGRMGPAADSTLDELVRIFSSDENSLVRREAALSAARIGPTATQFLPEFRHQLKIETDPLVLESLMAAIRVLGCYPES